MRRDRRRLPCSSDGSAATEIPLDRVLVPARQLDGPLDKAAGAAVAREEEAHVVLLVYRPD